MIRLYTISQIFEANVWIATKYVLCEVEKKEKGDNHHYFFPTKEKTVEVVSRVLSINLYAIQILLR